MSPLVLGDPVVTSPRLVLSEALKVTSGSTEPPLLTALDAYIDARIAKYLTEHGVTP